MPKRIKKSYLVKMILSKLGITHDRPLVLYSNFIKGPTIIPLEVYEQKPHLGPTRHQNHILSSI
jgi:hypothetical protein